MRILNSAGVFLAFMFMIGFAACSDRDNGSEAGPDQIYPLIFENDSLEIRKGITSQLSPVSSNGSNTLDVSSGDTSLLKAKVTILENGTSHASGWINLAACRKGHTSLTVYDRVARETAVLDVRITDFYEGMKFRNGNHSFFPEQCPGFLFLVDNDAKEYYYFGTKDQLPNGIIQQGTYVFSDENNTPYLTLTPDGAAACRFNLSHNDQQVYTFLNLFFHLGWESAATAGTKVLDRTMYLHMQDDATGKEVSFAIIDVAMPAGVLE